FHHSISTEKFIRGRYINEVEKILPILACRFGRSFLPVGRVFGSCPRTVWRLADCLRPEYVRAPAPAASAGNRYRYEPGSAASVRDQGHDRRRRRYLAVEPEPAYEPRRSDQSAGRTLVYLSGPDAAVPAALSGIQCSHDRRRPESANDGQYHVGHAQRCARFSPGAGPELPGRTSHPSKP